ncbi:hypothetical protein BN133_1865 [Cronobacter dublinensis 582]|nr:hypothetical protein BN133_1865 [Cronobacter dublinensis 582]
MNVRRFVKQTLVGFAHQLHYRRTGVRLPARIAAFGDGLCARKLTERLQHAYHVIFTAVDERADQADDFCLLVVHGHHAHIQGGFHHAFCDVRIADNAVRHRVQQRDKRIAALRGQRGFIGRRRFQQNGNVLLFNGQLVFKNGEEGIRQRFQLARFGGRHRNGCERFARDGVTQRAAVEIHQAQIQVLRMREQETGQQFIGVAEAQVDIAAGVAAFQTFERQFKRLEIRRDRLAGKFQRRDKIDAAGATHVDFAFFFGIGVDQNIRLQPARLQTERAVHPGFFGHGQQHFQRAVLNSIIRQHRQRGGHADAVVRAKRGAASFHPLAVDVRLDRIFREVMNGVVIFLRHHIQVRLQHDRLAVFHAGGRRFAK